MRWFYNQRIAVKLILSFGIVMLIMVGSGIGAINSMARIKAATDELSENWLPSVRAVMGLRINIGELRRFQLAHVMSTESTDVRRMEDLVEKSLLALNKDLTLYRSLISSPEEQQKFDRFGTVWKKFLEGHERILALSRDGKKPEAQAYALGESARVLAQASAMIDELVAINIAGGEAARLGARATYGRARALTLAVSAIALGLSVALALVLARIVSAPLGEAVGAASRVAEGDLTGPIVARSRCETGSLMDALHGMQQTLQHTLTRVQHGASAIASASSQIAAGNQDLSARTEQQASSLEETAASMDALTSTVRDNAHNTRQASQLAAEATRIATEGGSTVSQMVATMSAIGASSRQIADIIGVIDSIAFQTNILALNAAVEAARAGEQGRGFAVVANEVRNLAHRSAAAAKDIKQLINTSVERIEAGGQLAGHAGNTMQQIVSGISEVDTLMRQITSANEEQRSGIEQVNQAVAHMDTVTQQNAALVEEAAAAASALRDQARVLAELAQGFKLAEKTGAAAAPHASVRFEPRQLDAAV